MDAELDLLAVTIRRNKRQHRAAKYFGALRIAYRRVKRRDENCLQAVVRAARLVKRDTISRGFFIPIATCWLSILARIYVLLRQAPEEDLGEPVVVERPREIEDEKCVRNFVSATPRAAADVVYSDSEEDSEEDRPVEKTKDLFYICTEPSPKSQAGRRPPKKMVIFT